MEVDYGGCISSTKKSLVISAKMAPHPATAATAAVRDARTLCRCRVARHVGERKRCESHCADCARDSPARARAVLVGSRSVAFLRSTRGGGRST